MKIEMLIVSAIDFLAIVHGWLPCLIICIIKLFEEAHYSMIMLHSYRKNPKQEDYRTEDVPMLISKWDQCVYYNKWLLREVIFCKRKVYSVDMLTVSLFPVWVTWISPSLVHTATRLPYKSCLTSFFESSYEKINILKTNQKHP